MTEKKLCKCGAEIQVDGQLYWDEDRGGVWCNDVSQTCPAHVQEFEQVLGKVWKLYSQLQATQDNRDTYWEIYEKLWQITGYKHSKLEGWVQQA